MIIEVKTYINKTVLRDNLLKIIKRMMFIKKYKDGVYANETPDNCIYDVMILLVVKCLYNCNSLNDYPIINIVFI